MLQALPNKNGGINAMKLLKVFALLIAVVCLFAACQPSNTEETTSAANTHTETVEGSIPNEGDSPAQKPAGDQPDKKNPEEGDKPAENPEEGDKPAERPEDGGDNPDAGNRDEEGTQQEEGVRDGEGVQPEEGDRDGEGVQPEEGDRDGEIIHPEEGEQPNHPEAG